MYAKLTKIDRESHNWSEEMKFYRSIKGIELPYFRLILKIHWKLFLILMPYLRLLSKLTIRIKNIREISIFQWNQVL